ncbi:MAG: DUF898 family protein [Nitrospira sp.]
MLGPLWIWLLGQKQKYFWDHTIFGEARFSSTITWQTLFTLYLGNIGLLMVTLGWAWPWVTVRNARFQYRNPVVARPVDLDRAARPGRVLGDRRRPFQPARYRLRHGMHGGMATAGPAHYLDGRTATRHPVTFTDLSSLLDDGGRQQPAVAL